MCGVNGRNHPDQCFDRFLQDRDRAGTFHRADSRGLVRVLTDAQAVGAAAERIQLVHQFHQPRDGGIQMDARIEVRA